MRGKGAIPMGYLTPLSGWAWDGSVGQVNMGSRTCPAHSHPYPSHQEVVVVVTLLT